MPNKLPESLTEILDQQELDRWALFRTWNDLRRQAKDSEDFELHRLVGEAYAAFMAKWLTEEARTALEYEAEIFRLHAELQQWRTGNMRPSDE